MFLAGFLAGGSADGALFRHIIVWALFNPGKTPRETESIPFAEKLYRSRHLIPCLVLIVFIVWVMIVGWATATEAARVRRPRRARNRVVVGRANRETFWQSLTARRAFRA